MDTDQSHGLTYVLPLNAVAAQTSDDLTSYLQWMSSLAEVIVIDGSAEAVFGAHARVWSAFVRHLRPDADLRTPMGKVGSVLTGLRHATHELVIIADDDVRYDPRALRRVVAALRDADVVRPQNFFTPLPWHARWDTSRMLISRLTGGDWPGTLGVRRSLLLATGGYDGRALFENLELVRTVVAAGGREAVLLDTFVVRRPPSSRQFWSQRVRQAYDELARPARLVAQLAILPAAVALVAAMGLVALPLGAASVVVIAEAGRRRAGGRAVFPATSALFAPAWLAERAVCSWLAVAARAILGGVPYRGVVLRHAATPERVLRSRHAHVRARPSAPPPHEPRSRSA